MCLSQRARGLKKSTAAFGIENFERSILDYRRVSNASLANAALVLSSKNWKNLRDGGQRRKINPKSLGPAFSLCRHAGIDAALAKADFFFASVATIENRIEQKNQTLRWRLTLSEMTIFDRALLCTPGGPCK